MKSREHVTTNGRAVFFAAMWEDLKNAALSHGWALGLHGSLANDMDIMAMPWDEHANSVDAMIAQLCICFTESAQIEKNIKVTTDKPNNRTVYTLPIWADFYLDINVIGTSSQPSEQKPRQSNNLSMGEILDRVANDHSYDSWGDLCNDCSVPSLVAYAKEAMQEFAQQSMKQERERAIQECIDVADKFYNDSNFVIGKNLHEILVEKLKK